MELHEIIWERLIQDEKVACGLGRFAGSPAVFTPEAPSDQAAGWQGTSHYPRIVFAVDLSANEERKCQGTMVLSVFAENDGVFDFGQSVAAVRSCLCNVILTPEEESPYCLAWNRSDGFLIEGSNICGQEVQFDLLEYPYQETTDPDPVEAVNAYLKDLYPEALVLWYDSVEQAEEITAARPVFYCRLVSDSEDQGRSTFAVDWRECSMAIHVFCRGAGARGKYARTIAKQLSVDGELDMTDRSPFLVSSVTVSPSSDYLRTGQIQLGGRYGVLRQTEKQKQVEKSHISYDSGGFNER